MQKMEGTNLSPFVWFEMITCKFTPENGFQQLCKNKILNKPKWNPWPCVQNLQFVEWQVGMIFLHAQFYVQIVAFNCAPKLKMYCFYVPVKWW